MIKVGDGGTSEEVEHSRASKKELQTLIMRMKKNAEVEKDI